MYIYPLSVAERPTSEIESLKKRKNVGAPPSEEICSSSIFSSLSFEAACLVPQQQHLNTHECSTSGPQASS